MANRIVSRPPATAHGFWRVPLAAKTKADHLKEAKRKLELAQSIIQRMLKTHEELPNDIINITILVDRAHEDVKQAFGVRKS